MLLSEEMKQFREQYNLTQLELANQIGVTQSAIAKWESEQREPSKEVLNRFTEVVYSYKGKFFPSDNTKIRDKEKQVILSTIDTLLSTAREHTNIYDKRKTVKLVLAMLDEEIKRG